MIPIQNIKNNNNKRSIHKNIQNSEYLKKKNGSTRNSNLRPLRYQPNALLTEV